jgi:hypothetical protein
LEAEIVSQRKEAEKREEILTSHLKEISEDLNKLEAEFSQQERRLEEEIISLKTQLEEAKRMEEVMKIQMMKKEEDCEKLEEEVVTLRVEVDKLNKNLKSSQVLEDIISCQRSPFNKTGLGYTGEASCKEDANTNPNKNIEERGSSTQPVMKVEEKCSRLSEKKNEEKDKNYADILKGRNHGQQESKRNECRRDISQRRPSTSRYQRSFNHCEGNNIREDRDQPRHEFRRTTSQRRSFTSRYQSFFYGYCFTCNNFGHKVVDCRAYGRNVQARNVYVAPYNIECYKCHNYGHIAHDCRSMMDTSMKENIDIRYKKVWKESKNKKNR